MKTTGKSAVAMLPEPPPVAVLPVAPAEPREKLNILLVDDQPGKLLTYETMLASLGENLIKVGSGEEALQQLLQREFAVVLLDVCMPQLDGFELAQMIRSHPRCQRTAIIFISAVQVTNFDQLRGYELGAVDYMSVPVVPELLRARVSVFADLFRKSAALESMNRELELRVKERTAELEQDLAERKRLEQALMTADRRKDQFLAVLAHELRNPLAPIRTAVDTLWLRPIEDEAVKTCRDVIGRQVEQLTRLVDDLMDVSRITRGNVKLDRKAHDIATIVRRAVETQRPVLDARRHTLNLSLPEAPLMIEGDLTRLSEAIGNLLNNAAKYTEEGGQVWIAAGRGDGAHAGDVEIRVRDTGMGIPPELLPSVFEMFTQIDHTLHRSQGGLGIGLALVRELSEMHGGSIVGFSDGLGQGSEFVLRLPLREDLLPDAPRRGLQPEEVGGLAQRRVLVVDDNRDAALTLSMMLRLSGGEVRTANDGPTALAIGAEFRPDMVLLDIGMPGMNGFEVARRIRAEPWGEKVVLVAQTGWGQEEDRRRAREAGFDVHLTKPVDHAALMKIVPGIPVTASPAPAPAQQQPALGAVLGAVAAS